MLAKEADAQLTARWLLLRREEQTALERTGEKVIMLATALAERLLHASLELGPERIVPLARQVFAEAGGARRAVVEAHPVDAEALRTHLAALGTGRSGAAFGEAPGFRRPMTRSHAGNLLMREFVPRKSGS